MDSIYDGFDNHFDPNNPNDSLWKSPIEIYQNWQKKVLEFAPHDSLFPDFEINPILIYQS